MAQAPTHINTMTVSEAGTKLALVVDQVSKTRTRVVVEEDGVPVAAVVSTRDLDRLDRFDAEREADFAIIDEIGAAFRDVDPDEIERETANALAEVRAEMRVERDAGFRR